MSFYRDAIYPYLVDKLGNPPPIREIRQRLLPLAQGTVLEIGVGSGVNFAYYDPSKVSRLYALEPNKKMIRLAERHIPAGLNTEFLDFPGERIPLCDHTVDAVVCTFALSVIPAAAEVLSGIARVLGPDGRLIFFEHALAPDPLIRRWQHRCAPMLQWIFDGLNLTRDIPTVLVDAGYRIEWMEKAYLAQFPKSWAYFCWGRAIPPSP